MQKKNFMVQRGFLTMLTIAISVSLSFAADNTLTEQEKKDGWQLLFDGHSTEGWMSPKEKPLSDKHVQEGSLNPHPCDYMLMHKQVWENYTLSLDFKISPRCNSGIFVRTFPLMPRPGKDIGFNGIEIAIDDTMTAGFHDTGAIYDLVKPTKNAMNPVGQWNHIVISSDHAVLALTLNGQQVSHIDLDQWPEPNKRADGSAHKFDVAYKTHSRKDISACRTMEAIAGTRTSKSCRFHEYDPTTVFPISVACVINHNRFFSRRKGGTSIAGFASKNPSDSSSNRYVSKEPRNPSRACILRLKY